MGMIGKLAWMNSYSKKQCRSLFWRMRAAVKKAVKIGGKRQVNFQYDPSSYALNFDDGCCELGAKARSLYQANSKLLHCSGKTTRIYVIWIES